MVHWTMWTKLEIWKAQGVSQQITQPLPSTQRNQNQNTSILLVKRQNDNTLLRLGRGRLVPSSHKGSEFRYTVVRQFVRGDERIRDAIPVPDGFGEKKLSL